MPIFPDYDSFAAAYEKGEAQIVSTRLVADLETPVSAMLKLTRSAKYSFLLESVEGGAVRGRYSIIGMNPDMIWKVAGSEASINRKALHNPEIPGGFADLSAQRYRHETKVALSAEEQCPQGGTCCRSQCRRPRGPARDVERGGRSVG